MRPSTRHVLDAITGAPAWVQNDRLDVVAANRLARALYSDMFARQERQANLARFIFLNPSSRELYPDWDRQAEAAVAILRGAAGRRPHEKGLSDLVGELSTVGEDFRTLWATHDVRGHYHGRKALRHPVVGSLDLAYEGLQLPADPGLMLFVLAAEPGSPTEERLKLLASWAATQELDAVN